MDDRPRLVPPATTRCSSYGKNQILATAGARERPRMAPRTNRRPHYKSPQRLPTPLTLSPKHAARAVLRAGGAGGWRPHLGVHVRSGFDQHLGHFQVVLVDCDKEGRTSLKRALLVVLSEGRGGEGGRGAGRAGRGERDKGGSASSNRNTQRTRHGGACGCGGGTKTTNSKNIKYK